MGRVDTSQWGSFRIGDIFSVSRPIARKQSDYEEGNTPFVASGCFNNGVQLYLKPHSKMDIDKGGCLTISPVDGYAFYQEDDFLGRGGAGSSIIMLYNDLINRYSGQFIASVIRHTFSSWTYSNMGNKDMVRDSCIMLPINNEGNPDYLYMAEYMRKVEVTVKESFAKLCSTKDLHTQKIDVSKFRKFHLYDKGLFNIDSGTKLDKVKMSNSSPTVNFVGRANANNGVTDFIDEIEGLKPYEAGLMTLSLGGEYLGSCFIQDKPFYTSQNVNVLIPQKKISYYCKKYIATMIFKEGRLHYKAFIDELNRHIKTDFTILLPVDKEGEIDWKYMEQYMINMEKKAINTIEGLSAV